MWASGDRLDQKSECFKCPLIYTVLERIGYIGDKNSPSFYAVGMIPDTNPCDPLLWENFPTKART